MRANVLIICSFLLLSFVGTDTTLAQESAAEAAEQAGQDSAETDDTDRATRPGSSTTQSRRRRDRVTPQVTETRPLGQLRLKIGQEYQSVSLRGRNFGRVRSARVVDGRGRPARGYGVRINRRGRSETNLPLGVIAGPQARPGTYYLALRYDDPAARTQVQNTRPSGQTVSREPPQKTLRVPGNRLQIRATEMNPVLTGFTGTPGTTRPLPRNKPLVLRFTAKNLPGREVISVNYARVGGGYCSFEGWSTTRKRVSCDSSGAERPSTTRSGPQPGKGRDVARAPKTLTAEADLSGPVSVASEEPGEDIAELDVDSAEENSDRIIGNRFEFGRTDAWECYAPLPRPEFETTWTRPNELYFESSTPGIFKEGCGTMEMSVTTKNSRGETFENFVSGRVRFERRR